MVSRRVRSNVSIAIVPVYLGSFDPHQHTQEILDLEGTYWSVSRQLSPFFRALYECRVSRNLGYILATINLLSSWLLLRYSVVSSGTLGYSREGGYCSRALWFADMNLLKLFDNRAMLAAYKVNQKAKLLRSLNCTSYSSSYDSKLNRWWIPDKHLIGVLECCATFADNLQSALVPSASRRI